MSKSTASRFLTLQELCSLLGVSKASFYKYQKQGLFPEPLRTAGGRLIFDQEVVERCQQVVRTRTGINGEPVIFQTRQQTGSKPVKTVTPAASSRIDNIVESLASLGLTATNEQVERTIKELPADLPESELIRQLFLALRKQN